MDYQRASADVFDNFPARYRALKQWAVCGADKVPKQSGFPNFGAKSDDPYTWSTYEEAIACIRAGKALYPFFFTSENDVTTLIDIDGGAPPYEVAWIVANCDTYIEHSMSSTPEAPRYHLFVLGKPADRHGRKRDGFEIYSRGRGFVVTGNSATLFSSM